MPALSEFVNLILGEEKYVKKMKERLLTYRVVLKCSLIVRQWWLLSECMSDLVERQLI